MPRPYKEMTLASDAFVDELDDVLRGGSGQENFRDAGFFQGCDIGFRNDAADEDGNVVHTFFAQQGHELRADGVVGAGEDGEADDVDVFLDGGGGDHFRGLAQAGVNNFHTGVAESAGDDFGAAVMTVQPGLGNQDSYFSFWHLASL
jgi:hypothetical protein